MSQETKEKPTESFTVEWCVRCTNDGSVLGEVHRFVVRPADLASVSDEIDAQGFVDEAADSDFKDRIMQEIKNNEDFIDWANSVIAARTVKYDSQKEG